MEKLKEVAHISGKSGLYTIVKPTRTGVIVETLDDKKEKTVVGSNAKVSIMNEISVFMDDHQDSAKPLGEVLSNLNTKYPTGLDFVVKELSDQKLIELFLEVEPNFDRERVYPSDIKKILNWFGILKTRLPEIFIVAPKVEVTTKTEEETTANSKVENVVEEKVVKEKVVKEKVKK